MGELAQQAHLVSPLVDSVLAHCFRVSKPRPEELRLRRTVLCCTAWPDLSLGAVFLIDRGCCLA